MALFGNKESAEIAALQQQLALAHATIAELRGWVGQLRGAETTAQEVELRQLRSAVEQSKNEYAALGTSRQQLKAEVDTWRSQLVETRELALLQEVGVYEYAHPLDDALAYKDALNALKQQIKTAAKGGAVTCQVDWAVNGSVKEGQKLGGDMAKLMLRAYNAEADNAVRVVKPHTREAVKKRLTTTRGTIGKLGVLMRIVISAEYHRLRLHEIDLTADYLVKVEAEREETRAERERLREEAKVMKEIERERARLAKERAHYITVVAKLEASGDLDALARAREQLASVDDASVPFRFDTHALFFSEDAVALETALHQRLSRKRINLVNPRREFFYATPAEVKDLLVALGDDHVVEYHDTAEAVEWRASDPGRRRADGTAEPHLQPDVEAALSAVVTHTDADVDAGPVR